MENYFLFVDEINKNAQNPFFCLGGIVIRRNIYENEMIPAINDLKIKYFNSTNIIFHYTDMKKNRAEFDCFLNKSIRDAFWSDFYKTIKDIDFATMGVYFDYDAYNSTYKTMKNGHYSYAFIHILNNYMAYLRQKSELGAKGAIVFESRQWNENYDIQKSFIHLMECGTDVYKGDDCQKLLSTLSFFVKKDNCIGLQVADFVPDSFVRSINRERNYYNVTRCFMDKMAAIKGKHKDIIGLQKL